MGAAVAVGALGSHRPAGAQQPVRGGELRFGLRTEPDNLDPAVTPWAVSHRVMMHVYDTLVWQDPSDLGFKPGSPSPGRSRRTASATRSSSGAGSSSTTAPRSTPPR
jgi:ABC-type transport system substrate-binding protein